MRSSNDNRGWLLERHGYRTPALVRSHPEGGMIRPPFQETGTGTRASNATSCSGGRFTSRMRSSSNRIGYFAICSIRARLSEL